jgi:hypothetical protein
MLGINVRIYGGAIGLLWVEGQWTPPVWLFRDLSG